MGGQLLYKAPPDGYTLHLNGNNLWVGSLIQKVPYDPMKDFSPVTQVSISGNNLIVDLVKSGKLRVLAVTTMRPSALFPGVPTAAASGVPGYESVLIQGMWALAKTPEEIIK